jgi:hypothetical protein
MAPGLGRPVRPLAPPGRVLGQFHPSRTVPPWKKLKMFTTGAARLYWFQKVSRMALLETFCNHYRRAAPDVNIFFNFFHGRTVLDGWNGQIGALGVPGIAFGAVLGNGLSS